MLQQARLSNAIMAVRSRLPLAQFFTETAVSRSGPVCVGQVSKKPFSDWRNGPCIKVKALEFALSSKFEGRIFTRDTIWRDMTWCGPHENLDFFSRWEKFPNMLDVSVPKSFFLAVAHQESLNVFIAQKQCLLSFDATLLSSTLESFFGQGKIS